MEQENVYYEMLENAHVVFKEEQMNFWRSEIYTEDEFLEVALNLEELLKQGRCRLFEGPREKGEIG